MAKRFSFYLTFATCASFVLLLTTLSLIIIEYNRGTVQEIYDSSLCNEIPVDSEDSESEALFCTKPLKIVMISFQVITILSVCIIFLYHLEKLMKCSYGYQKMENNHLAIVIAAILTILLFLISTVTTIMNMRYVLSIGAFLVIDAVGAMLVCVTLYKQREKMEDLVETVLNANITEGLPIEQNAIDMYKMQGDQELKQRGFWNHFENMRVSEYYYLQKWCAELERLREIEADDKSGVRIDSILKEMQERWRELVSFSRLMPEDTYGMPRSCSNNYGEYSIPNCRIYSQYQNPHLCDHEILQKFY